jgi:hypothetical protein
VSLSFASAHSNGRCRLPGMKPSLLKTIAVLCFLSFGAFGQVPKGKRIAVKIEKLRPTSLGFDVLVSVKNIGTEPMILAESAWRTGTLQSLDVQQWDDNLGWQSVGPCRDVAPVSTVKLDPGESLKNTIPIGDKAHGNVGRCLRKIEHLAGRVRAILYFAYQSQQKFEARDPEGRVNVVSKPVELPLAN